MSFDPYALDVSTAARRPTTRPAGADDLLAVPQEAQRILSRALMRAIEGALDLWERTPAGHRAALPAFDIQHAGRPRFNPDDLRQQTLEGWHRLVRIELHLAVRVLEAQCSAPEDARYQYLLAEQCTRVGQLYNELKRRVGEVFAPHILQWELHLLRYCASSVINELLFPAAGR
jgi:hypothetical protein